MDGAMGVWFSNLLLLGFDSSANEDKFRITFDSEMFNLPNAKGMEVVLRFLFGQLDPVKAAADFRDCWPTYDKKQEQAFRRTCVQWFAAVARDDPWSGLPRQAASLLLCPEGTKFYQLLLNFSYYCLRSKLLNLRKTLANKVHIHSAITDGCGNSVDPAFTEAYSYYLSIGIINHTHHVVSKLQIMNDTLHPQWREYACELIEEYRDVLKERNERLALLKQLKEAHSCLKLTRPIRDNEREMIKSKVRKLWSEVDSFIKSTSAEQEVLLSVIKPSHDYHVIEGKNLQYKVPTGSLVTGGRDSNESSMVNLARLLEAGNECLAIIKDQVTQGVRSPKLTSLNEELEFVQQELVQHKAHIQSARNTRAQLAKLHVSLKKRIAELKEANKLLESQEAEGHQRDQLILPPLLLEPVLNVSLTPPSPEPHCILDTTGSVSPAPHQTSGVSSAHLQRPIVVPHPRYTVATPVGIDQITKEILSKHHRRTHTDYRNTPTLRHRPYDKSSKTGLTRFRAVSTGTDQCLTHSAMVLGNSSSSQSDPRTKKSDPRTEKSGARTEKSGARTENSDPRTEKSGARTEKSGARTEKSDPRTGKSDSKIEQSDSRIEQFSSETVKVSGAAAHKTSPASPPLLKPLCQTTPTMDRSPLSFSLPQSTPAPINATSDSVQLSTSVVQTDSQSPSVNDTLDALADKIANLVCSETTPTSEDGGSHAHYKKDYEAFVTRENIPRTPIDMQSNSFTKPVSSTSTSSPDPNSSDLDFDLLENEIPPTPYRDVGLLSPHLHSSSMRMRSSNRTEANGVIPLILEDDSL